MSSSTLDLLAGLNYVNAGLQCTNQLISDRKEGNPNAFGKFFFNLGGSAMRIGMADWGARHGNYWGYAMNSLVPYTNTTANAMALMGPMAMAYNPMMSMGYGFGMPMGFGFGMPMMPFGGHHCHHQSFTSINIRC